MFLIKSIGQWFLVSTTQSPNRLFVGNLLGVLLILPWLAAVALSNSHFVTYITQIMGMNTTRGALALAGVIVINLSVLIQRSTFLNSHVYVTRSIGAASMKEMSPLPILAIILYKFTFLISVFIIFSIFVFIVLDFFV